VTTAAAAADDDDYDDDYDDDDDDAVCCVESETLAAGCFIDATAGSVKMSHRAMTHKFKKIFTLSRCRSCDTYIYMNGGLQCSWVSSIVLY